MINRENRELLDGIIVGRVKPHIYAFTTNTIPNYLKIGDTYRPVAVRLREWMEHFPMLKKDLRILQLSVMTFSLGIILSISILNRI